MLEVLCVEGLVPNQSQDPSRSAHHNMWTVVLQCLLVLFDGNPTKKHRDLDTVKVLAKPLVLFVNLKSQFSVTQKYRKYSTKYKS